ncbi:MAG: HupE/UreJ family protein [Hyphomicrobiales bacterium]
MLHRKTQGWRSFFATSFFAVIVLTVGLTSVLFLTKAYAHFNLNVNIRIIHVSHEDGGLRMFIRLPMAYLVADKLGAEKADGTRDAAPFTTNKFEDEKLVHYLDVKALRDNPTGLGKLVTQGHAIIINGVPLTPTFKRLRAYPALQQVPFATLKEAETAIKGDVYKQGFIPTYVGDTVIDAEVFYPTSGAINRYEIQSTLDPMLPLQEETANLILDHAGSDTLTFRLRGLLAEPVEVSRSALKAFITFVVEGVRHIMAGADHILFVFCLVLGAISLPQLLWRITGFTIGHSLTLSAGFFGYTPQGAWFVPFVEITIALSIIYIAARVILKKVQDGMVMTTAIGLLHGLGFSFVLSEILKIDAPNLWQSLLAFNVGVEIGQVAIVVVSWLFLFILALKLPTRMEGIRGLMAGTAIAIASVWTGQRVLLFLSNL